MKVELSGVLPAFYLTPAFLERLITILFPRPGNVSPFNVLCFGGHIMFLYLFFETSLVLSLLPQDVSKRTHTRDEHLCVVISV